MPELHTQAMERRVILATPSSLFALCKAVSYGWRVEAQARNAKEIADLGRELYKRLSVMAGHVTKLGKSLGDAVGKYNDFVSSLETRVLVQARRFEELHADTPASPIPNLTRLDAPHRLDAEPDILTLEEAAHTSAP
jgi:DNA recombination protein RmuC